MKPTEIAYAICRHYLNDLVEEVSPALLKIVDGNLRSRNLAGLTSCSRHFDLAQHTVKDFTFLKQVEAFFKKNPLFAQGEECRAEAERTYWKCEANCSDTNLRLRDKVGNVHLLDEQFLHLILRMRRYIRNVLGEFDPFLDDLPRLVRVTPGATANASREHSLPQLKMRLKTFCTRRSLKYVDYCYRSYGFDNLRVRLCHRNRIELVPKNWKTDRTIACEPEGLLPLQLAFDTYAKKRLRFFGIDLSDQSANQRLAKHASIHGDYVTVDFSSASDTISYNTVALLFPEQWFTYLADVRSPSFRGVFGEGTYSKFSSMGNGSTFAIETLIFAAACYAVGLNRDFLVYGDDVIIRTEFFEQFKQLTQYLGFTVNLEKTFSSGPFRESCGGDYFQGTVVTPVYLRTTSTAKASLCHLVNTMRSICLPGGELEAFLRQLTTEHRLPRVPYSEDTMAGVWTTPSFARSRKLMRWKNGVFKYKAYVPKTRLRTFVDSRGYYLWFLMKNSQVLFSGPWALARNIRPTIASSVPVYDHSYVRKWVGWREPTNGLPDYLYWWSEL